SDTQLLKVIELVYHPAQVASVEVASPGRLFGDGVPLHIEHRAAVGLIQPFAKILRIATRETVRENLVDDRAWHPVGRRRARVVYGDLEVTLLTYAEEWPLCAFLLSALPHNRPISQHKVVFQQRRLLRQ